MREIIKQNLAILESLKEIIENKKLKDRIEDHLFATKKDLKICMRCLEDGIYQDEDGNYFCYEHFHKIFY